jgi:phosphatidylglycerol:prolipoprotein diacylglycerol transferase
MLSLAVYLHRLDPFALRISGDFGIRWYGLSYLAGFIAGYLVIMALVKRGKALIPADRVMDFIVTVALGTVIGGRLGYCIFYKPSLLTQFTSHVPFWGVLSINEGGMASHGGLIGIALSIIYFARKHNLPTYHLMDLIALSAPIGIFFGRIANFVNGELLGRPCSPDMPFAVKFPQEIYEWATTPPQFDAVAAEATKLLGNPTLDARHAVVEAAQKNSAIAQMLEPLLTPRHPSQLYEALLEGLAMFLLLFFIWAKPRKPGVIGGWFLVGYAAVRIIGEQFRLPDAHIASQEFAHWGVTRGQLLSFFMLAVGLAMLTFWSTRPVPRIGGWATKA